MYTTEEMKLLLSEIPFLRGSVVLGSKGLLVEDSHFISFVLLDPSLDPKEILPFYSNINGDILKELSLLRKLIYFTPLIEIPLYINIQDKVAKWRLQIGK
jgi:hypothetical protein